MRAVQTDEAAHLPAMDMPSMVAMAASADSELVYSMKQKPLCLPVLESCRHDTWGRKERNHGVLWTVLLRAGKEKSVESCGVQVQFCNMCIL